MERSGIRIVIFKGGGLIFIFVKNTGISIFHDMELRRFRWEGHVA